jgi:hypothetical protein
MRALILEDNRDRRVAMIGRLVERFPFLRVVFFETSAAMIAYMTAEDLQDVVVIALDHDLEMIAGPEGDWIDPGTGLDVARWLADQPKPLCPVVVHTTNSRAGTKMMRLLEKAKWNSHRVVPHDDLDWIETDWFRVVRNAIVSFAPQRRATMVAPAADKVTLIRSLLNSQFESGQAFCRSAIARIAESYLHDLERTVGDASAEVLAFHGADRLASALKLEGRVARWVREAGLSAGAFAEWADRGPLEIGNLDLEEHDAERLAQVGVKQLQVAVIKVADVQALLVVSAGTSLLGPGTQAVIAELVKAIEIALFVAMNWSYSRRVPTNLTAETLSKE